MSKITAVITCYNQAKYLGEAIESILNQTYEDFELIIVDDGSTDNTPDVVKKYMQECEEEITFIQTNDEGATFARHTAIARGKGEYFLPLDADDYISPEYFEKAVQILDSNPELGFVYCNSSYFGAENKQFDQPEYNFWWLVSQGNFISYCSLFRRDAYVSCGGYNLNNRNYLEDYELYIRLGKYGWYGKLLPEHLFHHRVHSESQTSGTQDLWGIYRSFIIIQYHELHPPKLIEEALEITKNLPENFLSLTKEEQRALL